LLGAALAAPAQESAIAIVGATLVDGNGGPPLKDVALVVEGKRIRAVGPRGSVQIPKGARTIDGTGKFLLPGLIDTNVHLSLYGGWPEDRHETLVRYQPRNEELVLESAQLHLKHGVTTVRDSYGQLLALVQMRDRIARGEAIGSRMLVAGNIVGWGGPYSVTFSLIKESGLTLFQEQMNDLIAQGTGEELMDMEPETFRDAIQKYLDKGPDFIKYGGTSHFSEPNLIGFSPRALGEKSNQPHLATTVGAGQGVCRVDFVDQPCPGRGS
jgi:cytosine/adenosine deaminase-related metal-dependent hydrolase